MRSNETSAFEHTSTNVAANPIPRAFSTLVVTASVGHIPNIKRNIGLLRNTPSSNVLPIFINADYTIIGAWREETTCWIPDIHECVTQGRLPHYGRVRKPW